MKFSRKTVCCFCYFLYGMLAFSLDTLPSLTGTELFAICRGNKGIATAPPKITLEKSANDSFVRASVVVEGKYQGIELILPEKYQIPIDQIRSIRLNLKWQMLPFYGEDCVLSLDLDSKITFNGNVKIAKDGWTQINFEVAEENFRIPPGVLYSDHSDNKLIRLRLWPNNNLDIPGEFIEIKSLAIIRKSQNSEKLPFTLVKVIPTPEQDTKGLYLTDGVENDKNRQMLFPQFGGDPELILDFGREVVFDSIALSAVAKGQTNIRSVLISTGDTLNKFHFVHTAESEDAILQKDGLQRASKNNIACMGRYLKLDIQRARHDVTSQISEIVVTGHDVTNREKMQLLKQRNDLVEFQMPKLTTENYFILKNGEIEVGVDKKYGIIANLNFKGKKLISGLVPLVQVDPEEGTSFELDVKKAKVSFANLTLNSLDISYQYSNFPDLLLKRSCRL